MSIDAPAGANTHARRRHPVATLSLKSLVLLMLLLVSVGSNIVVGAIGYLNGTDSLKDAAYDRLVEVRDSRAREVESLFESVENSLLLASRDAAVLDAEKAFEAGFAALGETGAPTLTPEQDAAVTTYFTDEFAPALKEATGKPADVDTFDPSNQATRYLLYHYLIDPEVGDVPAAVDDAGDGSAWSAAHAEYHDYLSRMAELLQFDDVVLIDKNGRVVYTVGKAVDLGTNLVDGPYSFTNLARAFANAMDANAGLESVVFTDFARYAPQLGAPVSWVVAPLADGDNAAGAIAVQLPIDRINSIMTGGGNWADSGLGTTGEAYLVGKDSTGVPTMRSQSRELVEDSSKYAAAAVDVGVEKQSVDQAVASGETLLLQPVNTDAARNGLDGETGTVMANNYLGSHAIAAYAPFRSHGLNWAIIAEIDSSEALAPVDEFTKRLAISLAIIVGIVSLISVIIAGVAVRPLRRLQDAAQRIAAGEQGVQIEAGGSDELTDVASAFNDMSRSLELKAALIEEQRAENDRLMLTLMPEALAKRYKEGVRTIVQDHQEVTVLFADIVGFEEFGRGMTSDKALDILNDIFRAFDEAAEQLGIERVRTTRQGYLASCGLSVPRVDHARRSVEFAIEMQHIVDRFGAQNGANLSVRAGLDSGTVTSGLVGRSHVVYDLWGDAVSLAFRLQGGANEAGVFVTQRVVDKLPDNLPFVDSGVVEIGAGYQRVWRIDPKLVEAPGA